MIHRKLILVGLILSLATAAFAATYLFDLWAAAVYVAETSGYGSDGRGDAVADSELLAVSTSISHEIDTSAINSQVVTIFLEFDSNGTTDPLTVNFYRSMDGANYDTVAFYGLSTPSDGAAGQMSVRFIGEPYIMVKLTSGTTNTWDYQLSYRTNKTSDSN